ncbi:MAG: TonB family protein [Betaproteobacteria bacterium]|nr:TonB family protein [Betaproteobacteria bacterium]
MSAVLQHPPQRWREPRDGQRWPLAAGAALLLEATIIGALLWLADHDSAPPPPAPMQIVLESPKPAPKTLAPPLPTPAQPKPLPRLTPRPTVRVHKEIPRARPKPTVQPAPAPAPPKVEAPPAPAADTKPAMAVPVPPPPSMPPAPPAPAIASVKATFEAELRSAIQAAVRYPDAAKLMKLTGKAQVAFDYRDAQVTRLRIIASSGSDLLDRAALQAVRNALLPPTPKELQGQSMAFDIWVRFHLNAS